MSVFTRFIGVAAATICLTTQNSYAQIAGYNTIYIEGIQLSWLYEAAKTDQQLDLFEKEPHSSLFEEDIFVDSKGRVENEIGQRLYNKVTQYAKSGLCVNGCVIASGSMGDLLTHYVLNNQARWLTSQGLTPLKIIATVDMSGASGGTELANLIALDQPNSTRLLVNALGLGSILPKSWGAVNDLTPNAARKISTANIAAVPHLRYAAFKDNIVNLLIKGAADGMLPAHSQCAATTADAFDSCSSTVQKDGKIAAAKAPKTFWFNHFPVLMTSLSHRDAANPRQTTLATNTAIAANNFQNGLNAKYAQTTETRSSWFGSKAQYLVSSVKNMTYLALAASGLSAQR